MSKSHHSFLALITIAAAAIGLAAGAGAATISATTAARSDTSLQSVAGPSPAAWRGHRSRTWSGHRSYRGYHGYRGYRGYSSYRGYYGWRRPYRGFYGYWGPNIYVAPYYYDYDYVAPRYYSPPPAAGSCAYWHRQCVNHWGYGNPNYRGCMRYQGCAVR